MDKYIEVGNPLGCWLEFSTLMSQSDWFKSRTLVIQISFCYLRTPSVVSSQINKKDPIAMFQILVIIFNIYMIYILRPFPISIVIPVPKHWPNAQGPTFAPRQLDLLKAPLGSTEAATSCSESHGQRHQGQVGSVKKSRNGCEYCSWVNSL